MGYGIVVATLTLGSRPKQGLTKVGAKSEPTFHDPWNVGECEGMNPHTPKWAFTLGVGVPMDFQIFRGRFQGSKPNGLKSSLYHWKALGT
jgi:hypothetical protein